MALLQKALNHRAAQDFPGNKHANHPDLVSLNSQTSTNSFASSTTSFYGTLTGESKVPKRRRPAVSTLGEAELTAGSPAPYKLPAGVEVAPLTALPIATHTTSLKDKHGAPKVSLLLHNYATEETGLGEAFYSSNNVISGQVRLAVRKPEDIHSIDVWVGSQAGSSVFVFEPHALKMHANLWPAETGAASKKFEPGTYSFDFSFEPLPNDVKVRQDMKAFGTKNNTSVALPPSFSINLALWYASITYEIGVDIKYGGLKNVDRLDARFKYEPRFRAIPRSVPLPAFPLITSRNEWPHERESIGGWSITPFGGRGRWNLSTMIEVEGLLGIRDPPVAHPGDELEVVLLLWSDHPEVLGELAKPDSIELSFIRTSILGSDALVPTHRVRKNRQVWPERHVGGRVWADGGDEKVGSYMGDAAGVAVLRQNDSWTGESLSSLTLSVEDTKQFPGEADSGHVVKLHGSVPVALSEGKVTPSFRYQNIAIEYLVHVLIRHPNYNHISPAAQGIEGEAPVWVVTGPRADTETATPAGTQRKFYGESVVPLNAESQRFPKVVGKQTDKLRPEWDDLLAGQGYRMYNQ
ncbi:hypothetical protein FRC08_006175 [Ceratobasidium sp. 394]|nr:hypothetical protein FRC08_006175 [Ceratobasidium sp. 394]